MGLETYTEAILPVLERELQEIVAWVDGDEFNQLHSMLAYHMGWQGESAGPKTSGKRIRPLLLSFTCEAAGREWQTALPAAAAVELVHNFSLIHDDIEDNSPLRRGRPTVWAKWGIAQALNAGDAMFTLAHQSILRLEKTTSAQITLKAARILQETCLKLTQGQFLDISYEKRTDLNIEDYWPMVRGKTAALLAACTELGALVAGVSEEQQASYRQFGHELGMAFQVQDDLLGVWGDAALTGKSAESDLLTGKKSLPVLFGLSLEGAFARRWRSGAIQASEVPELARKLESEGARAYTEKTTDQLTRQALDHLRAAHPQGEAGEALVELANRLLNRQG
jgi:geranylgeranyl diphosphate synthase type I